MQVIFIRSLRLWNWKLICGRVVSGPRQFWPKVSALWRCPAEVGNLLPWSLNIKVQPSKLVFNYSQMSAWAFYVVIYLSLYDNLKLQVAWLGVFIPSMESAPYSAVGAQVFIFCPEI